MKFGHCIKTGVDNKGQKDVKTCGIVAGDEESFTVFSLLFDAVIDAHHNGFSPSDRHLTNLNPYDISKTEIDPKGKYVHSSRFQIVRNLHGFRLPPCMSFDERRKVEEILVSRLKMIGSTLKGDYFPLRGSRSYKKKSNGMSITEEEELRMTGNHFEELDSSRLLSSGCGRHWPDARGIFHNDTKNIFVWINEEDHIKIITREKGNRVRENFNL